MSPRIPPSTAGVRWAVGPGAALMVLAGAGSRHTCGPRSGEKLVPTVVLEPVNFRPDGCSQTPGFTPNLISALTPRRGRSINHRRAALQSENEGYDP